MKSVKFLCILICMICYSNKSEAFLDLIKSFTSPFSKHNREIDAIISEALSTPKNQWIRTEHLIPQSLESSCAYQPENESSSNPKRLFKFYELHYSKHPQKLHTLEAIFFNEKESIKNFNSDKELTAYHHTKDIVLKQRIFQRCNIIEKDENSICYERFTFKSSQNGKIKINILGEEEITFNEPEIVEEIPLDYLIVFTTDLGNSEFRSYTLKIRKHQPTEEEKKYLIDLFKYMEAQIKNVSA